MNIQVGDKISKSGWDRDGEGSDMATVTQLLPGGFLVKWDSNGQEQVLTEGSLGRDRLHFHMTGAEYAAQKARVEEVILLQRKLRVVRSLCELAASVGIHEKQQWHELYKQACELVES